LCMRGESEPETGSPRMPTSRVVPETTVTPAYPQP
jgi:hypothetical protein